MKILSLFLSAGLSVLLSSFPLEGIGKEDHPPANEAHKGSSIKVKQEGKVLKLILQIPASVSDIELRFESNRNMVISKFSDDSPDRPEHMAPRKKLKGKEIWFPVVDLALAGMEGVAIFEGVSKNSTYSFNGNFWPGMQPLASTIIVDQLEHWENAIYVASETAKLKEFYLRKRLKANHPTLTYTVHCLTEDWNGKISVYDVGAGEKKLGDIKIEKEKKHAPSEGSKEKYLSRKALLKSLESTIAYLLRCQNKNPYSPTFGGLYLLYDLDASTYRRSDWMWSWGPAIKLLLEASEMPEIAAVFGAEKMVRVAREIGEASLRFQELDKDHPAYGLLLCRLDPKPQFPDGFVGFLSPADSQFLAGWGWIPLYEKTGDRRFLEAAILLTQQTKRILALDEVVEQDFVLKVNQWKDWTFDESGFGMEGIAELYSVTQKDAFKVIGKSYIENLLAVFQRDDGLWERAYHRNSVNRFGAKIADASTIIPTNYHTRGQGWAMEGLLASHRMMPEGGYLTLAKNMAEHLIQSQHPQGYWSYRFHLPKEEIGISEKGTVLWSLLFYRLYQYTKDKRHLKAARKALKWCSDNQYTGSDLLAADGIVGCSPASGVVYRHWFRIITTYTMSFYGLALLEEVKMSQL